jgi:hypothetical protein
MPLNFAQMLLQPTAATPWNFAGGGSGSAREQLKLARERFEYEKQRNKEQDELEQLKLNADKARAAALAEKERLDREAATQAELLKQQQAGVQKFGELAGSGKVEQAQAMVPYLDQLGYSVNDLGGVGGLPVFELQNRAQEAERQKAEAAARASGDEMAGLGYPTNERGVMEPEAGIASTEDAFTRAQAASEYSRITGKPAAGPDEEDYTGAVPRNVIDLPAQQAATLARLNPMLGAVQESYPTDYQGSASKTAEAVQKSGLPVTDALDLFKSLRQSPDELIKAGIQADAQKQQFREKRDQLTPQDISTFGEKGRKSAETLAVKNKIPEAATALELADQIYDMLDDEKGGNDTMIGGALLQMQAVKGDPSDRELKSAFGADKIGLMDELFSFIQEKAQSGFSDLQKEAIRSYVQRTAERQKSKVYDYLDSAEGLGSSYNDHEKQGFRERARQMVPDHWRAEWEDDRAARKGKGKGKGEAAPSAELSGAGAKYDPGEVTSDFDIELEAQAMENDLDPDKLAPIIRGESGGKAGAVSTEGARGVMQIMPDNLRAMGIDPEAYGKLSAVEQLPAVFQFLKDQGITADSSADDYVMAVAASDPKFRAADATDDMVVYKKGSAAWEANKPWRPADGGDITKGSILAYYGRRGGGKKSADAPKLELPEPTTPFEKRLRELMERNR